MSFDNGKYPEYSVDVAGFSGHAHAAGPDV
jgi:hypothetical protein